jgi:hypothetical protein
MKGTLFKIINMNVLNWTPASLLPSQRAQENNLELTLKPNTCGNQPSRLRSVCGASAAPYRNLAFLLRPHLTLIAHRRWPFMLKSRG